MKLLKVALVSIALVFSQTFALAAPDRSARTMASGTNFVLNQQSLQTQLLKNNFEVLRALYSVHYAKDQVNIARANLLPSLNLGGLLSFNGGGFLLASIDFLVPFLVPSNWYYYSTEKYLFQAEKISYNVIQLNTFSSALSLYFTVVGDRQVQEIYQQQYHDLQDIFEMQKRRSAAGLVPVSDLMQTQAQAQMAGVKASQLAELNKQELASLRQFLALPVTANIVLESSDMANSPSEFESLEKTIKRANDVSLERAQLTYLVQAAKSQKWSRLFTFINGFSVGSQTDGVSNAGFRNMTASGSVNFGFAQFPEYQMSQRQIEEFKIQDRQVQQENTRIVESTVASIAEARQQLDLATQAELQMAQVYEIRRQNYEQGSGSLIDVLQARNQMSDASVARVKAQMDVNSQRTTLHRTLMSAQFATIKGCSPTRSPKRLIKEDSFREKIKNIFKKRTESHDTLDKICAGK